MLHSQKSTCPCPEAHALTKLFKFECLLARAGDGAGEAVPTAGDRPRAEQDVGGLSYVQASKSRSRIDGEESLGRSGDKGGGGKLSHRHSF
jgi:hypothetical protein